MQQDEEKFPPFGFCSNDDAADEEHHPYNNDLVHYHSVMFRLRQKGKIKEVGGDGYDAGKVYTSKSRPSLQPR